jgi:hypothetical protein
VVEYVRTLERGLVAALEDEGVTGARARVDDGPDYTGVWVQDRKIASIGVHVARGVTTHGFAVNVENDLQPFGWIVPCGLDGVAMTSLIKETGRSRMTRARPDPARPDAERAASRMTRARPDQARPDAERAASPSGRMHCFRKRTAFQVARALGRRQRIVSRDRLEAAVGAGLAPAPA